MELNQPKKRNFGKIFDNKPSSQQNTSFYQFIPYDQLELQRKTENKIQKQSNLSTILEEKNEHFEQLDAQQNLSQFQLQLKPKYQNNNDELSNRIPLKEKLFEEDLFGDSKIDQKQLLKPKYQNNDELSDRIPLEERGYLKILPFGDSQVYEKSLDLMNSTRCYAKQDLSNNSLNSSFNNSFNNASTGEKDINEWEVGSFWGLENLTLAISNNVDSLQKSSIDLLQCGHFVDSVGG